MNASWSSSQHPYTSAHSAPVRTHQPRIFWGTFSAVRPNKSSPNTTAGGRTHTAHQPAPAPAPSAPKSAYFNVQSTSRPCPAITADYGLDGTRAMGEAPTARDRVPEASAHDSTVARGGQTPCRHDRGETHNSTLTGVTIECWHSGTGAGRAGARAVTTADAFTRADGVHATPSRPRWPSPRWTSPVTAASPDPAPSTLHMLPDPRPERQPHATLMWPGVAGRRGSASGVPVHQGAGAAAAQVHSGVEGGRPRAAEVGAHLGHEVLEAVLHGLRLHACVEEVGLLLRLACRRLLGDAGGTHVVVLQRQRQWRWWWWWRRQWQWRWSHSWRLSYGSPNHTHGLPQAPP